MTAYVDGCCTSNGKPEAKSGVGIHWPDASDLDVSCILGGRCSNNRAEILASCLAILIALDIGCDEINIYTDSNYVLQGITNYVNKWLENNWRSSVNKPIVNEHEFKLLHELCRYIKVNWRYVAGHGESSENRIADDLATSSLTSDKVLLFDDVVKLLLKPRGDIPSPKVENVLSIRTCQVDQHRVVEYQDILKCQLTDPECQDIIKDINVQTPILEKKGVAFYKNAEGLLCASGEIAFKGGNLVHIDAPYVPLPMRNAVISGCHDVKWINHPNVTQTYRNVLKNYFWNHFRRDITNFVSHCGPCQKSSGDPRKAPVQEFIPAKTPFSCVALDVVGPLIKTVSGNQYILSIIDTFSRYALCVALPDQTSVNISMALERELIAKCGCPETILTDRGSNFRSEIFNQALSLLKIKHSVTGPYRPETNGLVERFHRELKRKIAHLCQGSSQKWDQQLHLVMFAYNNSTHGSINKAPNEVVFGKILPFPNDPILKISDDSGFDSTDEYISDLRVRLSDTSDLIYKQDRVTRNKRNAYVNQKRILREFVIGEKVLYKIPIINKNRKHGFRYRYTGPYIISDKVSGVSYDIRPEIVTNLNKPVRAHINRLKRYNEPIGRGWSFSQSANTRLNPMFDPPSTKGNTIDQSRNKVSYGVNTKVVLDTDKDTNNVDLRKDKGSQGIESARDQGYLTRSKGKIDNDIFNRYSISRGNIRPK